MRGLGKKPLKIIALEKRLMLDASLAGLVSSIVIPENTSNATEQVIDDDGDVTVTGTTTDFNGESLTISTSGGAEDQLNINNEGTGAGQIGVSGTDVTYEGTIIGTLSSDGSNGTNLTIDLNANASKISIERLIENVTYQNTSDTPAANRTINFALGVLFSENVTISIAPENDAPNAGNNTGITVAEGATLGITDTELSTTDTDHNPNQIIYTVTNAPIRGQLELTTNAGVAITSFTQQNIDDGELIYVHDGSESVFDKFDFTVSDGAATLIEDTFNITVNVDDEAPTITTNNAITVSLGFSTTIGGTADDFGTALNGAGYGSGSTFGSFESLVDSQDTQMRFVMTTPASIPSNDTIPGQVIFETGGGGRGIGLFLNSNNELAIHAGAATPTPRLVSGESLETNTQYAVVVEILASTNQIKFHYEKAPNHDWYYEGRTAEDQLNGFNEDDISGSDGGGYGVPSSTGSGNYGGVTGITPGGTTEFQGTLDSNLILTRLPGSTPEANTDLVTSDPNDPAGAIIYTITNVTDYGTMYRDGVALGLSDTFTQADLNKGLITYDSTLAPPGPGFQDAFSFSVNDGTTTLNDTFIINVNTVNTAPDIYDEVVIYDEDFTGGTAGWNHNRTTTDAVMGEFWGRFNRDIDGPSDQDLHQTFALSGTQSYITVEFDFFELDTWDNEELFIFVNDTRYTIGNNLHRNRFDRPGDITNANIISSVTELSNANGYILSDPNDRDQIYRFQVTIPDTAGSIKLGFGTNLNGTSFNDESFGIDNLQISELVAGGAGTRSVDVSELITDGERVTTIMAGDDDVGQTLSYSITGGSGVGVFDIDANGNITVIDDSGIDFETGPASYTLDVQIQDDGPGLLTDTQTITINILDALENTRPNIDNQTLSFAENAANGTSVGTPTFTDAEGDAIELWQIIDGNELGVFTIDQNTGEITIADNGPVNFENDNRYDIRLRVWDDADLGLYHDRTIRIDVTNVDDAPSFDPEFIGENSGVPNVIYSAATGNFYRFVDSNANYATALANAEGMMLNGTAGHLLTIESNAEKTFVNSISDQHLWMGIGDMAQEGVWRYTSGPNEGLQLWQGTGSNNGGQSTNGFFTDWRGTSEPNNGTAHNGAVFYRNDGRWVDVRLTNNYRYMVEWEGTDVVNNDTYYLNYDNPADLNNGDSVGTVQGLDPEGDTLTYSLTGGGTGTGLFNLDPVTGEVTIANAGALDPNIDYTLTVRATEDNGTNQFAETTITIILNENLSIDANNGHTATEGLTSTITPAELTVTDGDGVATDIIFDIDTLPTNGQLELSTNPGVGIIEFSLDDLNNSRVRYVHDGSETLTDSFTFNVTDGGQTLPLETFNITITPVNDAPTINVNTGTGITEGGTVIITNAMLDSLDTDNTDTQLTYTASGYVLGQIEVSGNPQNTFTQDDINNNLVVFRHDGNEGGTASFNLSLADTAGLTDTATFNMAVTAVNDSPTLGVNTGFSVLEGGTFTITTGELSAIDPDDTGTGLYYDLTNITGGFLQLSTNSGVPILDFTHADLVAGRVQFVHDGSEQNASFDVEVSDDGEHGATTDMGTVNVTRIPVNDAPDFLRNNGSSVNEGGLTLVNEIVLSAQDPDNTAAQITYTITNEVNGQLELLSNLGVQITSFTQAQLEAGDIVFRHDGSGTVVASFDMELSDGSLTSAIETFNFTVDNVNDPPVISVGPSTTVVEGQSVAITTSELNSLDPDNLPATLIYTVTSQTNGVVYLNGTPSATFTQAELSAGLVTFVHDGSETLVASFDVELSDGALTDTATVNMNVDPRNDQASLVVNDGDPNVIDFNDYTIDVHDAGQDGSFGRPGVGTSSVDGSTLTVTGNAWKKIDIPYTLTANTVLSFEIFIDGIKEIHGIGFDNDTVHNNGFFGYQLAGSQTWGGMNQAFNNYSSGDGWVRYDIPVGSDYTGAIANLAFVLDNDSAPVGGSVQYRNVNFYESGAILDLNEGNTFNITTAHINSVDVDDSGTGLTYNITNQRNGQVQVSGINAASFTQDDLDNDLVTFVHDGSETLNAGFDISLVDGLEHGAVAQNDTFNLIINPVNDDTVINTNNTITLAENATATISSADLNITDVDDSPNDVIINITSTPTDGHVALSSDAATPITSFTLAQLNAGEVRYVHNGAENAADSFQFTVTDGDYTSVAQPFNLTITPVNDNTVLTVNNPVNITESGTAALSNAVLNTTDPDNTVAQRTFTITDKSNGWIELTTDPGFPISSFTQDDVANGRVLFRHDGSGAGTASFDFSVSDPTGTPTTGTFNLNVNTPVNEGPVVAITDGAPTTIDFTSTVISPYDAGGFGDGQGATATDFDVSSDGSVLTVYGNAWKKIPLPMTLTTDTVLTFDFRSTKEGELHSIGFDNDDSISNGLSAFQLFGNDTSGLINTTYNSYNLGDGWTRFEIPVGATFTGAVTDLYFAADDDVGGGEDGISQFRNVSVYEANPTITMNEGGTLPLTNANLNVFDTDHNAANLIYNVTGTTHDHVALNGILTTAFTQDDINNGRVAFIHDGSETITADFDFTVTDGTITTAVETLSLTVNPVQDPVSLVLNTGTTVNEHGNVTITNLMLDSTDIDSADSDITYIVNSVSNGHIEVNGTPQNNFTQVDIDNGDVVFVHDGSETTSASFDFSVSDTISAATNATFSMTAVPTNDTPYDLHLSDKDVSERDAPGRMVGTLTTSDVDLPGDAFTYTIMNDPSSAFSIVGNQLMLNAPISFAAFPTVDLIIQTDDGNGGTFDQMFTIDVERVDDGNVSIPNDPNFGGIGRGLLEERKIFESDSSPLIQNFVNGDGNAYYGETSLGQIIRENTTFEIASLLDGEQSQSSPPLFTDLTPSEIQGADDELSQRQSQYTRMVDFLKSTEEFSGEESDTTNDDETINNDRTPIQTVEDQFDNILTYHEQRAINLVKALKNNIDTNPSQ
jgi:hypothetical protein